MDPILLLSLAAILGCVIFGIITIVVSFKEDKLKKAFLHLQEEKKLSLQTQPKEQSIQTSSISSICAVLDKLDEGVCVFSENLEIVCVNSAMQTYLGFKSGPIDSKNFIYVVSEWYPLAEKLKTIATSGQDITDEHVSFGTKLYTLHLKNITLNSNQKEILFLIKDETEEKDTEENRETVTNMMVHELRSPLSAIKSSGELIVSGGEKLSEEQRKNLITLIVEQSRKLLDQVGSILDAAKLKNGKLTMNKTPNDLIKILNDRISLFSSQASTKHVELETDVDSSIPVFMFDSVRMGQLVNNLMSNSLKFTPAGGKITLNANLSSDKKSVIIEVKDSGVGISEEKQKNLFTKYTQSATSVSSGQKQVGTGLGLYVVKGIVDAHNGTISVSSKENQGTTITISLPLNLTPTITIPPHKV